MDEFERFLRLISPIKSVFSLYLLMYMLPISIPVLVTSSCYNEMVIDGKLNVDVAVIVGICTIVAFGWTTFFLIYFTNQRNNNPDLYQKGFMLDFNVEGSGYE